MLHAIQWFKTNQWHTRLFTFNLLKLKWNICIYILKLLHFFSQKHLFSILGNICEWNRAGSCIRQFFGTLTALMTSLINVHLLVNRWCSSDWNKQFTTNLSREFGESDAKHSCSQNLSPCVRHNLNMNNQTTLGQSKIFPSLLFLRLSRHHDPGGIKFQHRAQSRCGCVLHPCSNLRGCALPAGKHGRVHSKSTMSHSCLTLVSRLHTREFLCKLFYFTHMPASRYVCTSASLEYFFSYLHLWLLVEIDSQIKDC